MRIDVNLTADAVDKELALLHERIHSPGDALHGMPSFDSQLPGLVFHYRESDGEFYLYVEDVAGGRLAGYTVFNRVVELNRRADRYLHAPHSRYAAAWQRRGVATAVYQWALNAGMCLISGPRQSPGAHALWRSLARQYELGWVQLRDKSLRYLGRSVEQDVVEDFHTRMVLLGIGWDWERLLANTGAVTAQALVQRAAQPTPALLGENA